MSSNNNHTLYAHAQTNVHKNLLLSKDQLIETHVLEKSIDTQLVQAAATVERSVDQDTSQCNVYTSLCCLHLYRIDGIDLNFKHEINYVLVQLCLSLRLLCWQVSYYYHYYLLALLES